VSVLVIDSHVSHAAVIAHLRVLGGHDLIYYSDTRCAPLDELSPLTRVSRVLTLLDTHALAEPSVAVLLGRGMSREPRAALALGARRAGIELVFGADLVAGRAGQAAWPRDLCIIGDSCVTRDEARGHLRRGDVREVRWSRIAPEDPLDEPLLPLLERWGSAMGAYLLATPDNRRVAAQIARVAPGVPIVDEHEQLALALAERLPAAPTPGLRVLVTEGTPAVTARIKAVLGVAGGRVLELGRMEAAPTAGPFAMSLDADGEPS
jgi:hypothetical protein